MQNQRSLSGVVSVNRQAKQHHHFPQAKTSLACRWKHRYLGPSHNGEAKPALYFEYVKMAPTPLPQHDTRLKRQRQADVSQDDSVHNTALGLLQFQPQQPGGIPNPVLILSRKSFQELQWFCTLERKHLKSPWTRDWGKGTGCDLSPQYALVERDTDCSR